MPLSDRTKKLLAAILFLAVIAGVAAAIYVLFFRAPAQAPTPGAGPAAGAGGALPNAGRAQPTSGQAGGQGSLPSGSGTGRNGTTGTGAGAQGAAEAPRTTVLVNAPTQFVAPSGAARDAMRFYNPADGKFYRTGLDGQSVPLSDRAFYNVQTMSWANTDDRAILEFPDGSNVYFDFKQNRQVTLPKHWEDFTFAPSDERIVAKSMGNNESNRYLILANPDGSNAEAIQELGNNGDKVETAWSPDSQIVAYAHTGDPIGFDREQVILVGKNHENLPGLITEGRGFIPKWSPQGSSLAYSVYTSQNGYLPELWISGGTPDTINANRRRVELNTWADKCTWGNEDTLYCAVPETLEPGAGLQRDAVQKGPDRIFRVNLKNGQKTNLGGVDGVKDVQTLNVSADGKTAFVVDRASGRLSKFDLSR